jgi:prepilin-type N-terminal cleavage/methylation domain-containing protein
MKRPDDSGFTLVELLVAAALLALVTIGLLNMLDTSTTISKVEAALADTQENVRFAAYHIVRTARMAGGGEMPFARADGTWIAGEVQDDETGAVTLPGFGTVVVAPGSDVLTLRGFYEAPPFFTNHNLDINNPSDGKIRIRERRTVGDATSDIVNPLGDMPTVANAFSGRGVVFMGRLQFAVGEISASALSGADPSRVLTLDYIPGGGVWPSLNPGGAAVAADGPLFNVYRVGILQSYTYYVRPDFTLMRRRAAAGGWVDEPVAINIGSLQVITGLDTDGDGEVDTFDPDPGAVAAVEASALRITVLGRTPFEVKDWTEPTATFQIAGDNPDITLFNRGAKWRRMDVTAGLRNFIL